MSTRTITTKKFSSETTNAIPASDDRILFSDTSDGGAPKDATIAQLLVDYVDKLTDQDIDAIKTFLKSWKFWYGNNTSGGNMKVNWFDHVYYELLVNLVRKAYIWFAWSWLTSLDIVNEFTNWNINLQPGSGWNLIVQSQNRTGAWTSYSPTVSWSSWSWTVSVSIGKYKQIWKTVFVAVKLQITNKNTLSWDVAVSLPVLPNNSIYLPINWYCVPNAANPSTGSRADAEIDSTAIKFKKSFNVAWLQWSDITNTDWIVFNWTYEAS